MTKPALAEGGVHSGKASTSLHFFVGNLMLPLNYKNTTEVSMVMIHVILVRKNQKVLQNITIFNFFLSFLLCYSSI